MVVDRSDVKVLIVQKSNIDFSEIKLKTNDYSEYVVGFSDTRPYSPGSELLRDFWVSAYGSLGTLHISLTKSKT